MQRSELEHIIRASGEIANDEEVIIIGSQAILGQFPDAPARLLASMETDVYPRNKPELADMVDGAIGEGSSFHELNGYYAQGVGPETATLPLDWQSRLVRIRNENTGGVTGLCLEAHDLASSKLVAGRAKDFEYVHELARHGMIEEDKLLERLTTTQLPGPERTIVNARIKAMF
jgi:hypothetical protein